MSCVATLVLSFILRGKGHYDIDVSEFERFGHDGYDKTELCSTDELIDVVADCGRHSYQKFSFELKVPLKEADDVYVVGQGVNKTKLLFIIEKWMEGRAVTRRELLKACKNVNVYGAVELEIKKRLMNKRKNTM